MNPTKRPSGGTECQTPAPAGALDLQGALRLALRDMAPAVRPIGHATSWRLRDIARGRLEAGHTLQAALDERISQGASLGDALAVSAALELYIRARIAQRDGTCGTLSDASLSAACEAESAVEGSANPAQWRAARTESAADIQRAVRLLMAHRGEIDNVVNICAAKLTTPAK